MKASHRCAVLPCRRHPSFTRHAASCIHPWSSRRTRLGSNLVCVNEENPVCTVRCDRGSQSQVHVPMGWKGRLERQQYADVQKEEFRKDRREKEVHHELRMKEDAHTAHLEGRGPARYNDHDEAGHAAKLKRKSKNEKAKAFMRSAAQYCMDDTNPYAAEDAANVAQAGPQEAFALPAERQLAATETASSTLLEQCLDNAIASATAHGVLSEAQVDNLTDALAEGRMSTEACIAKVEEALNQIRTLRV